MIVSDWIETILLGLYKRQDGNSLTTRKRDVVLRDDIVASLAVKDCSKPWLPRLCKCRTFYPMDKSYDCVRNNNYCRLALAFLLRLRYLDIIKAGHFTQ